MPDQLTRPDIKQFIREHEKDDVTELMLNSKKYPDLPLRDIAEQIKSRQKAENKLPEWYSSDNVIFPPHYRLQQSSSELTARFKSRGFSGERFLDLTGGTGVDAYYFLKHFNSGVITEPDNEMAELLEHNLRSLGTEAVEVQKMRAEDFLSADNSRFDLIYLDPSRRDDSDGRVFLLEDCAPDVTQLLPELQKRSDRILIKASPMLDHNLVIERLRNVEKVTILSVADEVKELLICVRNCYEGDPTISCVDLNNGEETELRFKAAEEEKAEVRYSEPLRYLYDPLRVIRKSGAFRLISERYDIAKLEVNTHLYTSDRLIHDFPGRIFEIKKVLKADRKSLIKEAGGKKVNLATRNYASDISVLRKKLGVIDGGRQYVFAALTQEGYRLILCDKI